MNLLEPGIRAAHVSGFKALLVYSKTILSHHDSVI